MTLKTVTTFLADLQKAGGPSSTNQYDLEFACGDKLKTFLKNQYDIDETRYNGLVVDMINETQIPGVSLTSQDIKQVHKGINMKPAVAKVYNEMDFSVILDITSDAFKFFTAWQLFIQGGDTHFEDPQKPSGKKYTRAYAQNYYSDYVCGTKIKKYEKFVAGGSNTFNDNNYHVYTVELKNSYPYMMSSIPFSSDGSGVVKLSIGMYYEYSDYTPFAVPKATYTSAPVDG